VRGPGGAEHLTDSTPPGLTLSVISEQPRQLHGGFELLVAQLPSPARLRRWTRPSRANGVRIPSASVLVATFLARGRLVEQGTEEGRPGRVAWPQLIEAGQLNVREPHHDLVLALTHLALPTRLEPAPGGKPISMETLAIIGFGLLLALGLLGALAPIGAARLQGMSPVQPLPRTEAPSRRRARRARRAYRSDRAYIGGHSQPLAHL
jgi:hypothetical protein